MPISLYAMDNLSILNSFYIELNSLPTLCLSTLQPFFMML
jgi:hypothetical protein